MVEKRKVITAMVPFFMNLKDSKKTDINQIIIVMDLHLQAEIGVLGKGNMVPEDHTTKRCQLRIVRKDP